MKDTKASLPGDTGLPSSSSELSKLTSFEKGTYPYSVEDFFRKPEKNGFSLSPCGQYYSFLAPVNRRMNIFVQKIGEPEATQITNEAERDISSYGWANSSRLIYIKDAGGDENFRIYAVDRNGDNLLDLIPIDGIRIEIIDKLDDFEDEMIIGMNKNMPELFEPYRLNIVTGDYQQIAENSNPVEPISSWMTDHEGKLRLATQMVDGTFERLLYRRTEKDPWKEVITLDFKETLSPLFFDFDNGDNVYALSNLGRDKAVIIKYDLNEAKEIGAVLFEHPEVDANGLSYSKKRKVISGASYTTDKSHRVYMDDLAEKTYRFLEDQFPDHEAVISNSNKEENLHMVRTYSDRSLGAYYVLDTTQWTIQHLTDVSPWIDESDLSAMKHIQYTSRDGLTINGYLTLPKGKASNLPLVVNPHLAEVMPFFK